MQVIPAVFNELKTKHCFAWIVFLLWTAKFGSQVLLCCSNLSVQAVSNFEIMPIHCACINPTGKTLLEMMFLGRKKTRPQGKMRKEIHIALNYPAFWAVRIRLNHITIVFISFQIHRGFSKYMTWIDMTHYSRWCIYIHNALVHVIASYQFRVPQCENGQSRFTALAPLLHCTVGYGTTLGGCSNWDLLQKICAKTRSNGHWHRRPNLEIQTSYFPADFLKSAWLGHEQSCKLGLKFLFWFLFRFIFQIWLLHQNASLQVHYAAVCESEEPLEVLLTQGFSPHRVDSNSMTPLMYACIANRPKNITRPLGWNMKQLNGVF